MSIHPSLSISDKDKKQRSVLKRSERLRSMMEKGQWKPGDNVYGLPKIKTVRIKIKKEKAEKTETATTTEAAAGAAPEAKVQAAAKASPAKGQEKSSITGALMKLFSMIQLKTVSIVALALLLHSAALAAEGSTEVAVLSAGQVTSNDINVRVDSSVGSEAICRLGRGVYLEITAERYDWYKIRLPENAPSYIKKEFVNMTEDDKGVVVNDKVNIRLRPDMSSPILGKARLDEPITVLDTEGEWLKIKPINNSFGWIHKNFVKRTEVKRAQPAKKGDVNSIIVEGKLRHKTFTRVATHKLTTNENKVYLLQGKAEDLNPLNDRSVRVTGKIVDPAKLKYPIIAVEKIEALD